MTDGLANDLIHPYDDGKVSAQGSVWKLYFEGETPTEAVVAETLGAVKAQMVAEPTHFARVTPTNPINKEEQ